ncbi:hypothetical protein RF11_10433 [Thelohanellus kitauei]|uniref:ISXO2-like transposase domain-containing protein n=1 Tax=Thelohanellus kitauei TaxID=669202 RepID=A0A0C2NFM4_THEKT|nr:hypothetical protein RF11_10433 [Thelohanellus kitauei]
MCALKLLDVSRPIERGGRIVGIDKSPFYRAKYYVGRRLGTDGGTNIVWDCWRAYNGIMNLESGYTHLKINHLLNCVDPMDRVDHTQNIENFRRCVKKIPLGDQK